MPYYATDPLQLKRKVAENSFQQNKAGHNPVAQFIDKRPEAREITQLQQLASTSTQAGKTAQLRDNSKTGVVQYPKTYLQKKANNSGLPDALKQGVENLSGIAMDDVRVHYNSEKPSQLNALAYAQGTDIHLASGQEKHLPHEAWHVVQQKQGRVKPILQVNGFSINDSKWLEIEADEMGQKVNATEQLNNSSTNKSNSNIDTIQLKTTYQEDIDKAEEARNTVLESHTPIRTAINKYVDFIINYKIAKPNSTFREKSALGLAHWARHFNMEIQGSFSELRRINNQITQVDKSRRPRFGIDNTNEPDIIVRAKPGGITEKRAEEIKGVSTENAENVMNNLRNALNQLDKDRADEFNFHKAVIYITNPDNPWPFDNIKDASGKTKYEIYEQAENVLKNLRGAARGREAYEININGINMYDNLGALILPPGKFSVNFNLGIEENSKNKKRKTQVVGGDIKKPRKKTQKQITHDWPASPPGTSDFAQ